MTIRVFPKKSPKIVPKRFKRPFSSNERNERVSGGKEKWRRKKRLQHKVGKELLWKLEIATADF